MNSLPKQLIEDKVLTNYMEVKQAIKAIKKALKCQRSYAYKVLQALEDSGVIEIHPARIGIVKVAEDTEDGK